MNGTARYVNALTLIAAGADNPAEVAQLALAAGEPTVEEMLKEDPFALAVELAELTTRHVKEWTKARKKAQAAVGENVWDIDLWDSNVSAAALAGWFSKPQWAQRDVDNFPPAQTRWLSDLVSRYYQETVTIPKN
jgi:hypothetical protein